MRDRFVLTVGLGSFLLANLFLAGCTNELDMARGYAKKKDYELAARTYNDYLKKNPKNKVALREVADLYCGTKYKNSFQCKKWASQLYKLAPKDAKAKEWYKKSLMMSAYDFTLSSSWKRAREYLRKYMEVDPNNAKALFMLGSVTLNLNSKPPYNKDSLMKAAEMFRKAIKNSSATTRIDLSTKIKGASVQWESYYKIGEIHFMLLHQAKVTAMKKKRKVRRRRRRRGTKPKYKGDPKMVKAALDAYAKVASLNSAQNDKKKHFLPFFQSAMIHEKFNGDTEEAVKWISKAEAAAKAYPRAVVSVYLNGYMLHDYLSHKAKKARNRKAKKEHAAKAKEYKALFQKTRAAIQKMPKPRK